MWRQVQVQAQAETSTASHCCTHDVRGESLPLPGPVTFISISCETVRSILIGSFWARRVFCFVFFTKLILQRLKFSVRGRGRGRGRGLSCFMFPSPSGFVFHCCQLANTIENLKFEMEISIFCMGATKQSCALRVPACCCDGIWHWAEAVAAQLA